jgi:hypothetical protein
MAFIRALGNQSASVIRSEMPLAENAAYFRQMIHRDFDLTGICRFVLAPYWRIASRAERHQGTGKAQPSSRIVASSILSCPPRRYERRDLGARPTPCWAVDRDIPFRNLFADRLVRFYGRRLAQSGDGDFVVTDSPAGPEGVVVISRIVPRQGASIAIGWRLGLSDGVYKIPCAHRPLIMQQLPRKPSQEE